MKKILTLLILLTCTLVYPKTNFTDEEIKQLIITESIASYSGKCPCPFTSASNGSACGKRSAYSRPGGYSPICYPQDITKEMVEKYRWKLR